jgi:hypothetical protein
MEAAQAAEQALAEGEALPMASAKPAATRKAVKLDEDASPTAGRRFTRV